MRGAYPAVNPAALSYNGLGALVASTHLSGASSYEDFTVDGLGNRRFAARPSSCRSTPKCPHRCTGKFPQPPLTGPPEAAPFVTGL